MTETDIQTAADQHYASRFGEIERLLNLATEALNYGHDQWYEDMMERLYEMPLCIDCVAVFPRTETAQWEILLGTGGPADRVLVTTSADGQDVEEATYQHQEWFTPWTDANGQNNDIVERFAGIFCYADWSEKIS